MYSRLGCDKSFLICKKADRLHKRDDFIALIRRYETIYGVQCGVDNCFVCRYCGTMINGDQLIEIAEVEHDSARTD